MSFQERSRFEIERRRKGGRGRVLTLADIGFTIVTVNASCPSRMNSVNSNSVLRGMRFVSARSKIRQMDTYIDGRASLFTMT